MATMASRGEGIVAAAEQELRAARKQQWEEKAPERDAQAALVVPWRERIDASIARSRKVRGGNYVQIATVDEAGLPRCRTVVFRGWVPASMSGDHTLAAAISAVEDVTQEPGVSEWPQ